MDNFKDMELVMEIKALKAEITKLEDDNKNLKQVILDNDLGEDLGIEKIITPEEEVCTKGIEQILERVRNKTYDNNDVKNFDIFHKHLRMIKGQSTDEPKKKEVKTKIGDLIKIAEGSK